MKRKEMLKMFVNGEVIFGKESRKEILRQADEGEDTDSDDVDGPDPIMGNSQALDEDKERE